MKKLLLGIGLIALATVAVKAQHNPCVAYSLTNCSPRPSVALAPVTPITVSVCTTVSASTTMITNAGKVVVNSVDESCVQLNTTIATNYPTIVSNWTAVYWNSQWTTNAGLSASFTPANAGSGMITFYVKYSTPWPCVGLYTTNMTVSVTVTNSAPVITSQPANQTVIAGNSATFNVSACGSGLGYQWRFNGAGLPGATADTFTTNNVQASGAGTYTVVIANSAGSVISTDAVLTVLVPPTITTQPASQTVAQGGTATFNVVADGSAPLSYQWRFNGANLAGATSSLLALNNVQEPDIGSYSVVVTNLAGVLTSSVATLSFTCAAPPSGLVAWWPGDGSAEDISGNGRHGTLYSGAGADGAGLVGRCFTFDGSQAFVAISDTNTVPPATFTIEGWVWFDDLDSSHIGAPAGDQYIFFKQNMACTNFEGLDVSKMRVADVGDVFRFRVASSTGESNQIQTSTSHPLTTGVWYHIAAVRGDNDIKLYLNGQLESQTTVSFAQNYNSLPLYFGTSGQPTLYDGKLKGKLDEAALYNRALSDTEIQAIYDAGAGGKCPPPATVTIVSPTDGASVHLPASPVLVARAYWANRAVSKVEFFNNGSEKLGESVSEVNGAFTLSWTPSPGSYVLTAVATYNGEQTTTSTASHVTVHSDCFLKGINLNGDQVTIEGNQWFSHTSALSDGLSIQSGVGFQRDFTPIGADSDTKSMLTTMLTARRLPTIADQSSRYHINFDYHRVEGDNWADRTVTFGNVPSGQMIENTEYQAWCINEPEPDVTGTTTDIPCNVYYSCGTLPPGIVREQMNMVNWILNNKQGNANPVIQCAIWKVLGTDVYDPGGAEELAAQARQHQDFIPGPSDSVGVIIVPFDAEMKQPLLAEIPGTVPKAAVVSLSQTNSNGSYLVYLWLAESEADYARSLDIKIQGNLAASGVGNLPLGRWQKLGPYQATVTGGALTVEVSSPAQGDPVLMGLAIYAAVTNQPPYIITQPTSQTVGAGQNTSFDVEAGGTPPLYYQWRFSCTNLAGASLTSLTLTNIQLAQAGSYTVQVTNAFGSVVSSNAVLTISNLVPVVVQITWPTNGQIFLGPTNISITASVSNAVGVANVEFYAGSLRLGADPAPPYDSVWSDATAGTYTLTARATDQGIQVTSAPVQITVREGPSVFITYPPAGWTYAAPARITLDAVAQDPDGQVTNVALYLGSVAPENCLGNLHGDQYYYSWVLTNVLGCSNVFIAVATDNDGYTGVSPAVPLVVQKQPPAIRIVWPHTNDVFAFGEPISIQAEATDADGTVTNVQVLTNGVPFTNIVTASNHTLCLATWTNAPAGASLLSGAALDNDGLSTNSSPVPITVLGSGDCPVPGVTNLYLSVTDVLGGGQLIGTVVLSDVAVNGGQVVNVFSSSSAAQVPASIHIFAGQQSNSFVVSTSPVDTITNVTVSASYHGQAPRTGTFSISPRPGSSTNTARICGKMDVALVIDTSGSMAGALSPASSRLKGGLADILTRIEAASGGDYRLALVTFDGTDTDSDGDYVYVQATFADRNAADISDKILSLSAGDGGWTAECSDEALRTVIHQLPANSPAQYGSFDTPFRDDARKLIILVTDAPPDGFNNVPDDEYGQSAATYVAGAHLRAVEAGTNGIQISAVFVGGLGISGGPNKDEATYEPNFGVSVARIMQDYAETTGGVYLPVDGMGNGMAPLIESIIDQCGTSKGETIFVRDDQFREYPGSTLVAPQFGSAVPTSPSFDMRGLWGDVSRARFQRAGAAQSTTGSRFDLELGIASLTNVSSSFGVLFTNAQSLVGPNVYAREWEMPAAFYRDIDACLGGVYYLRLSNRVSSVCGQSYTIDDSPQASWPVYKNILTTVVEMNREIPRGHCRDFILHRGDPPANGTWDIVYKGVVVASSGHPSGWDVEKDHTSFGGFIITASSTSVVDDGYKMRVLHAGSMEAQSVIFSVLPADSILTAPVLRPLTLSTNTTSPGGSISLTVSLDRPAPVGDAYVPLYTNGSYWATVVIPAGETVATTSVPVPDQAPSTLTILGSYNGLREAKARIVSGCDTPGQPQIVSLDQNPENSTVVLAWTAVSDADRYCISRSTNGTDFAVIFDGLSSTSFVDWNLPALETTYYYQVTAFSNWCATASGSSSLYAYPYAPPAPLIYPASGSFNDFVVVLLTNYIPDSTIWYTTNATVTGWSSLSCGGVLVLTNSATLKAYVTHPNYSSPSPTKSAELVVVPSTAIQCGDTPSGFLARTSPFSTVRRPGFFCTRYRFDAAPGDVGNLITLTASSSEFDTLLFLKDGSTNILASNDDYQTGNTDSQVSFRVRTNGVHIVEVTSYWPGEAGSFTLRLDCREAATLNVFTNAFTGFTTNSAVLPLGGLIDFGVLVSGSPGTNWITITNSGSAELVISNIAAYPSAATNASNGFSVSPSSTVRLDHGAVTNLAVSLLSTEAANFAGYVTFESNDAGRNDRPPMNPFYALLSGSVRAAAGPPLIVLYFPTNGMNIPATNAVITNVTLEIAAVALDEDGIQKVEFYTNISSAPLATLTAAPYTAFWTNPPAGPQTITARAYDNSAAHLTSQTNVSITVGAPGFTLWPTNATVGLSNSAFNVIATLRDAVGAPIADAQVTFTVLGAHGLSYTTNTLANGQASFTYTGTNSGADRITASATLDGLPVQSETLVRNWARSISCGDAYTGSLSLTNGNSIGTHDPYPARYSDYCSLTGSADNVVTFKTTSPDFSTFMFLLDTNGASLAVTNEALNLNDTRVRTSLPTNGTYLVEITSSQVFQTGSYAFSLGCGPETNAAPDIALLVSGTNLPNCSFLDLGVTNLGGVLSTVLTVTNRGNTNLNLTAYYFTNFSSTSTDLFSLAPSPVTNLPAGSNAAFTLRFASTNGGQVNGALVLANDDPGKNPFVVYLSALANPNGSLPSVSITAPTNGAAFIAPASIAISADASASEGSITNVEFGFRDHRGLWFIGRAAGSPYATIWQVPQPGAYSLLAAAWDNHGRMNFSSPVEVQVRPSTQNRPPVAVTDRPMILAASRNNVLNLLTNDYDPDGDALTITRIILSTAPGMHPVPEIVDNGKAVRYTPPAGLASPDTNSALDGFSYEISDGKGGTALGGVYVIAFASEVPRLQIVYPPDGSTLSAGHATNLMVSFLNSSDYVTRVEYWIGGDKLGETNNAPFTFNWLVRADQCNCGIQAVAYDIFGQRGVSDPMHYTIEVDPNALLPVAQVDNPAAPSYQIIGETQTSTAIVRDGFLVVTGSVYAVNGTTTNDAEYKVLLETGDGQTILQDTGWLPAAIIHHGVITTNDLTTLRNDLYQIELYVRNEYGTTNAVTPFILDNNLKIGQFAFSEQDLVLPAGGAPLSVVRSYDSLNPSLGDFGYSWTYALNDLDFSFHEERAWKQPLFDDDPGPGPAGAFSMRTGGSRDVTLTLPDGHRTTFYYYEEACYCEGQKICACPHYSAPEGVHATLQPVDQNGGNIGGYDFYTRIWSKGGGQTAHDSFDFPAFLLTMPDGTQYFIAREHQGNFELLQDDPGNPPEDDYDGETATPSNFYISAYTKARLGWIKLPSGEKISINSGAFTPGGSQFSIDYLDINGRTNRSVWLQRDDRGLITAIYDPNALAGSGAPAPGTLPSVAYDYDANTNLWHVARLLDRASGAYATNTYLYENSRFPHYLTRILDPRGVPAARNLYDDSGKLIGVIDSSGKTNVFQHDVGSRIETTFDRMGNRTIYGYDTRGNVTTVIDPLGHVTQNTYDGQDNLKSVMDPLTNTTYYGYDNNGNRTQVVDPLGHTNLYTYDTQNNNLLLSHTDPLGNRTWNTYDSAGNLTATAQRDAQDNLLSQSISTYVNGRLAETRDANTNLTASFGYDDSGNLVSSTNAQGFVRTFAYDASGNQTRSTYTWTNAAGDPVTVTNATEYDAQGRVVRVIDADGNTNRTFYNAFGKTDYTIDKLGNTNRFCYDARGNLIQTISPDGLVGRTMYDDNARPVLALDRNLLTNRLVGTRTEYDLGGRVTQTVRVLDPRIDLVPDLNNPGQTNSVIIAAGTPFSTNATEYYDNGWVKSRTGPDGQTTRYEYGADGQVQWVTDPLNHRTFSSYDEAGRQTVAWDARNHGIYSLHDGLGRVVATVFQNATGTTNVFNLLGQRSGQIDQAGRLTQFGYDPSGQLTSVTKPAVPDPDHPGQMTNSVWTYGYDLYGRLTVVTDPNNHATTNIYDALGRQVGRSLAENRHETNVYNGLGQLWKRIDFKGQVTEFKYDRYGRARARFYFGSATEPDPAEGVAYHYNALGQLEQIIELRGQAVLTNATDGYPFLAAMGAGGDVSTGLAQRLLASLRRVPADLAGGLTALALVVLGVVSIPRHMRRSWLMAMREACSLSSGERARVRGNLRLRLPSLAWRAVTVGVVLLLVANDPAFQPLWAADTQCSIPANPSTEEERVTGFAYDLEGRLTQVNAPEGVINYGYDLATGRHTSTCTTNSYVQYGYDELGRLKTVTVLRRNAHDLPTPEVTTYTYDAVGNRASVTLPNGTVSRWLYDDLNRLTNLTHTASSGTLLASYSYQLHATGRRTNAVEVLLNTDENTYVTNTLSWQYDAMYRLTNEVSVSSLSANEHWTEYQYDKAGNRLAKVRHVGGQTETTRSFYDANDQLLREETTGFTGTLGTNSYAYDANGSLTGKTNAEGVVVYAYNLANKLSSVTAGGHTTSYLYNDQGIRVRSWRVGDVAPALYLVDGNNATGYAQVLEELNARDATPSRSYVLGDDVLGQCGGEPNEPRWLLYDGHGSTRQLVHGVTGVTSQYHYDAYGNSLTPLPENPETSHLYCGEQYDPALQMYNLRARYYDPSNGRFNQRDAFEGTNQDPQNLHKYLYANCDPVNGIDPSGNMTLVEIMIVGAIIGGLAGLTAGALIGVHQSGRLLSWTTLKYAIIGLVTGALAGAIIAAGGWIIANGGFSLVVQSLQSGIRNLVAKAALQHSKTMIAAIFGFAAGFITGILDPDAIIGISGAVATAETTLSTVLMTGIARLQTRFVANLGPAFFAVAWTLYHYIAATTFIGIGFGVGFVGGFIVGSSVRRDYDKGGVTRDLVAFFTQ